MQDFFFITVKKRCIRIFFQEVRHILIINDGRYVQVTTDKHIHIAKGTLRGMEMILPPEEFARVNRETIIPIDRIESFDRENVYLARDSFSLSDKYRVILLDKIRLLKEAVPGDQKVLAGQRLELS